MRHFATNSAELTVNADEVRTEELYGRTHVVAPVTLVREMVLKGELLPFEEIQRTAMAWNGAPVTVTHPRDEDGGFLPASMAAAEFERHAAGHVFGADPDADRRALDGEVYVDADRAAEIAVSLDRDDPAEMLLDGDPVEVSTGYWYRKDDATGEYEGAEYDAQQRDVQPDHLATLPNGEGECSLSDGCGAGVGTESAAASSTVAHGTPVADGGTTDADPKTAFQRFMASIGFDDGSASGDLETACNCTGDCDCDADADANNGDDTTMTIDMDELAAATGLSTEKLESMDDDELTSLAEATLEDDDGDGDGGDDDTPDDDTPDDGDTDGGGDTANTSDVDVSALASAVADEIGEDLDRRVEETVAAQTGRGRDELVATIQRHSDNADSYDLDEMSLSALRGLAEDVSPTGGVYAGRAGGAQSGDDVPESTGVSLDALDGGDD